MDAYLMLIVNLMVDAVWGYKVIGFMDKYAWYNQHFMVDEDIANTFFRYSRAINLYEWIAMTFTIKNMRAIYQHVMFFLVKIKIQWIHF